jgi:hypothetical protein
MSMMPGPPAVFASIRVNFWNGLSALEDRIEMADQQHLGRRPRMRRDQMAARCHRRAIDPPHREAERFQFGP